MRLSFGAHARITPVDLTGGRPVAGRLRVPLPLEAGISQYSVGANGVLSTTSRTVHELRDVDLYGPRDVGALAPGAVVRSSPPEGAGNVDGEFCVFVELRAPDLPWRYSPTSGPTLLPWIALVAGVEDSELGLDPDGTLWLAASLTTLLNPAGAKAWAHTEGKPARSSRLLCTRALPPGSRCLAAVVPLLDDDGQPRWHAGQPFRGLPVHHRFRFMTNDDGTFEQLVAALKPAPCPPGLGEALLHADPGGHGSVAAPMLGALAPVAAPSAPPFDPTIAARVDSLLGPSATLLPGQSVPSPVFGAPRHSLPFQSGEAPWVAEVDTDPRHRAAAGLGARAAIEWQERIMTAAGERLGQTHLAAGLLRHLVTGVSLSASTSRRRPAEPAARLAFHGPALPTVVASGGAPALDYLCPPERALPAALLSTAAAHLLRATGPTAKASADPTAVAAPGRVISQALTCPHPVHSPILAPDPPIPSIDVERAAHALRDVGAEVDVVDLRQLAGHGMEPAQEHDEDPHCREPETGWVDDVAHSLDEAFHPGGAAASRVVGRITGLHEDWNEPLEVRPDLDLPLWDWLRRRAPEWLLPRAGLIPRNGIVALRTNRAFVAACLIGASRQALSELRWRGVPISAGTMPMRTFWQQVSTPENPPPMVDLVQPSSWPWVNLDQLPGMHETRTELVIALRSDLVRRYPDTEVYLAPAVGQGAIRDADLDHPIAPSFAGRLDPDVWFFGFPRPPSALPELMLVLEEPDRGPRFHPSAGLQGHAHTVIRMNYQADGTGSPETVAGLTDGASYAKAAYANPIRAICDGRALLHSGEVP